MSKMTKEAYVSKLKKLNEKLRNKLKDLNSRLERVLDRINTKQLLAKKKSKEVPVEKQINVCDKEIENAQKQLEGYRNEILRLNAKGKPALLTCASRAAVRSQQGDRPRGRNQGEDADKITT